MALSKRHDIGPKHRILVHKMLGSDRKPTSLAQHPKPESEEGSGFGVEGFRA